MHHALEIDEILLNIIAHCNPHFKNYGHGLPLGVGTDLVALARTCRMFKEPALDVLWWELYDLSPLAQCLPKISYQVFPRFAVGTLCLSSRFINLLSIFYHTTKCYSFRRPLEEAEWNTLRSYTHRVRSIIDFRSAFYFDSVKTFLRPAKLQSLFPNLRYLRYMFTRASAYLLHQHFPSLISLDFSFATGGDPSQVQETLESFLGLSLNLRKLSIGMLLREVALDKPVSDFICRLSNPQTVFCPQVSLDVNAITHLSRTPGLNQLSFALSVTPSDTLLFSTLYELELFSESLVLISDLLDHIQLPAVTDLAVEISSSPSRQNLTSFLAALQQSGVSDSITRLKLDQIHHIPINLRSVPPILAANDLRSGMAFRNLRRIDFNCRWNVGLTDTDLLTLVSAWPHLEHFLINEELGWLTSGGITPNGLVRLLQTCPLLSRLSLAIDTRDYTDIPPARSPASLGLTLPPSFSINVVDSVIDTASVPAMAAFFVNIVLSTQFSLSAWESWAFPRRSQKVYADRWKDVYVRAGEAVAQRSAVPG